MDQELKKCCECWSIKPTTEFHKNRRRKDGLAACCKACSAWRQRSLTKRKACQHNFQKINAVFCKDCGQLVVSGKHIKNSNMLKILGIK